MKKALLLLPVGALAAYISLSSYTTGMPANYTGSRGGTAGCGASRTCHGNATSTVNVLFELDNSSGSAVSSYTPGATYTIKLILLNGTLANLPKFGFQLSSASGGFQAGAFVPVSLPINTTIDTFGSTSLAVWEHVAKLPYTTGGGGFGTTYQVAMRWVAPDTGFGPVTFYAAGCLVNNNGSADTIDDKWNVAQRVYSEDGITGVTRTTEHFVSLVAYPNPTSGIIKLTGLQAMGFVHVAVMDLNGRILSINAIDATKGGGAELDVTPLTPGMYQIVVTGLAMQQSVSFVKQ